MKKRFINAFVCLVLSATVFVGCGKGGNSVNPNATKLDFYIWEAGVGTEWLTEMADDFVKLNYVKETYGDVVIDITKNREVSYASSKIKAGAKANNFSLLFSVSLQELYSLKSSSRKPYLEKITDVYDSNVLGEDVKISDKMLSSAVLSNAYTETNGDVNYYALSWLGGYNGILYNVDLLADYGDVPVTTDEMLAIMSDITADKGYSIMQTADISEGACYWEYLYPTWWAQYEGYQNYIDFWNGKVNGEYSKDIFKQKGRLYSLTALEEALGTKNANLFSGANSLDYMEAQTRFLMGNGVFMACGDWFDSEMAVIKKGLIDYGYDYDIQLMKTPVISAIIEKTPSIVDDATLAEVVKAVDAGLSAYDGVNEEDFAIVAEARQTVFSVGNYHNAVIPEYTPELQKKIAKDFLRYMGSDKANEIFIEKTDGSSMFFKYNVKESNPDLYSKLLGTGKLVNDFFNDETHPVVLLPSYNNFPLFLYGGVRPLNNTASNQFEIIFRANNAKTALEIYNQEITFWGDAAWAAALATANLN